MSKTIDLALEQILLHVGNSRVRKLAQLIKLIIAISKLHGGDPSDEKLLELAKAIEVETSHDEAK
jgi:hypothetical protein